MRTLKVGFLAVGLFAAALGMKAQTPAGPAPGVVVQGIPPRISPAEYQAQGKAGQVTIAAEFAGHGVPTPQATFNTEEYVVVEIGVFGAPGSKLVLAPEDFSLRVNGKKGGVTAQPYGLVVKTTKDPEWEASVAKETAKSKTSLNTGGGGGGQGGGQGDPPPAPPKMPIEVRRAMELKIQKASLPEGERALPVAGLIYFQYSGKVKGMKTVELLYSGAAGKVTIPLQP
jgi:hypothetical protein